MKSREIKIYGALLAASILSTGTVPASTILWTNTTSGNWSESANWDPNQVPGLGDDVLITSNGTYVVALDVSASVASLTLGGAGGTQTLTNSANTLRLSNASAVNTNGILGLSGGTLSGSGLLTVRGLFNWSGGSAGGPMAVASNGLLNLNGSGTLYLGAALTNAGTVTWTSGDLALDNCSAIAGPIVNAAGGLWDIQCDQTLSYRCYQGFSADGYFENAGTVRKSAGIGTTYIRHLSFYNSGAVIVLGGTLGLSAGGTLGGTFSAAAGTTINLSSIDFSHNFSSTGAVVNGSGTVEFTDGSLILSNDVANLQIVGGTVILGPNFQGGTITNLTLAGSTLSGNYNVSGTFDWSEGTVQGALTIASNGVLNLNGSGTLYLACALTNAGTITWTSGDLALDNCLLAAGPIVNSVSGLWNIQCDQILSYRCNQGASANGYFQNAGRVRKSTSIGITYVKDPFFFYNAGSIEADTGVLYLQAGYSGDTSANLAISLGGSTAGSGYGQISFANPLELDGTFAVSTRNAFRPNPGDTFQILSYPSATSAFTCLNGLDLGAGLLLLPQFTDTGLTLVAATYSTNSSRPQLFITPSPNGVLLTWPLGFPGFVLQSTTNLTSPLWVPVPAACANQAVVPVNAPRQYFRLKQ